MFLLGKRIFHSARCLEWPMPHLNPRLRRQEAQRPGTEIAGGQRLRHHDATHRIAAPRLVVPRPVAMRQGQGQAFGSDGIRRVAGGQAGQDIAAAVEDRAALADQFGQQIAHMLQIGRRGEAAIGGGVQAFGQDAEPARDLSAGQAQPAEIEIGPGGFGDDQMRQHQLRDRGGIEPADIGKAGGLRRQAAPEVERGVEDGVGESHVSFSPRGDRDAVIQLLLPENLHA